MTAGGRARSSPARCLLVLAGPARAAAAANFEIGMEDERLLLSEPVAGPAARSPGWRPRASTSCASTRAGGRSRRGRDACTEPRGFDAANHRSTPLRLGDAGPRGRPGARGRDARDADDHRPRAAVDEPRRRASTTRAASPSPALFATFARAVATRYGDRVDRYLIWNEPNQPGWLQPQWTCDAAARLHAGLAAHLPLARARGAAGDPARRPGREVVMGELAPVGHAPISTRSADRAAAVPARAGAAWTRRYKPDAPRPCRSFKPAQRGRLRLPPARRRVRARRAEPGSRRGAVRRPLAAVHVLDKLRARAGRRAAAGASTST